MRIGRRPSELSLFNLSIIWDQKSAITPAMLIQGKLLKLMSKPPSGGLCSHSPLRDDVVGDLDLSPEQLAEIAAIIKENKKKNDAEYGRMLRANPTEAHLETTRRNNTNQRRALKPIHAATIANSSDSEYLDSDDEELMTSSALPYLPLPDPSTYTVILPKERIESVFNSFKRAGEQAIRLLSLPPSTVAPFTGASDDANLVNSTWAIPTATRVRIVKLQPFLSSIANIYKSLGYLL